MGEVLRALADLLDVPLSIDTSKAAVAARAIETGAAVINDVWGLQKDRDMAAVVAETEAALIIMHNREEKDERVDILADIRRFFDRSLALAAKAGVPEEVIILDPGIGFGKTSRQNVADRRRHRSDAHWDRGGQPCGCRRRRVDLPGA